VVEYEALVNGLRIAIELGVRRLDARGDSQLVIDQVMKNSHCRDPKMEAYCDEVRRLEDKYYGLELNHIARHYNETADELSKIASGRTTVPPEDFSRDLHQPSVKTNDTPEPEAPSAQSEAPSAQPEAPSAPEGEALRVEEERSGVTPNRNWHTSYLQYLHQGELPLDRAEARRLARRAKSFVLLGDGKELYHRSPSCVLQRCISIAEGQELLQEIHSGACGHHAAPRALVGNAFDKASTGRLWWPTPLELSAPARGVNSTQGRHTCPLRPCRPYPSPGRLLCGVWTSSAPCRRHPGGYTHLLVAIDKFSKWIEIRPLNCIRSEQAVAFFTNIIHRFGVPISIITDNGTQFTSRKFLDFCEDHHIRVDWAAVAHPMTT
jgi:hypothetical protein